ncbi:MAG: glycosyltransferase, partial [Hyphomicrobiales bacterium]
LYITRNGLLEPLGQSQVLAYLKGLSGRYRITVISFEKAEDVADEQTVRAVAADCANCGIRWLPQRFRHRPRLLAAAWNLFTMLRLCLREIRGGNADLVHARSYIPAAAALFAKRLTGTPFIFDMRALWPEELVAAGRVRRGSWLFRLLLRIERRCLQGADYVVSLTHAAVVHLREIYPDIRWNSKVAVIPTCADLERFVPDAPSPSAEHIYGCVGSVLSGWFRLDWLGSFFEAALARDGLALFHIITRDDPSLVRGALAASEAVEQRLTIYAMSPREVHRAVQRHYVSIMFFNDGLGKLGSSPTRMGEVLGCGIPVVANAGVGDVEAIVAAHRIGVLVEGGNVRQMHQAVVELELLMQDPELGKRCRTVAENLFSLQSGIGGYAQIYDRIGMLSARRLR